MFSFLLKYHADNKHNSIEGFFYSKKLYSFCNEKKKFLADQFFYIQLGPKKYNLNQLRYFIE